MVYPMKEKPPFTINDPVCSAADWKRLALVQIKQELTEVCEAITTMHAILREEDSWKVLTGAVVVTDENLLFHFDFTLSDGSIQVVREYRNCVPNTMQEAITILAQYRQHLQTERLYRTGPIHVEYRKPNYRFGGHSPLSTSETIRVQEWLSQITFYKEALWGELVTLGYKKAGSITIKVLPEVRYPTITVIVEATWTRKGCNYTARAGDVFNVVMANERDSVTFATDLLTGLANSFHTVIGDISRDNPEAFA